MKAFSMDMSAACISAPWIVWRLLRGRLAPPPELERLLEALQPRRQRLPVERELRDLGIGEHVAGDDDVRSRGERDQPRGEVDGGAEVVEHAVLGDRDAG